MTEILTKKPSHPRKNLLKNLQRRRDNAMAMDVMTRMDENSISKGSTNSGYYGGKGIVRPQFGFGIAYGIGHPCWAVGDDFVVVHYCEDLEDQPLVEGFGPDRSGNLISLGKLPAGWFVTTGNPGRIGG